MSTSQDSPFPPHGPAAGTKTAHGSPTEPVFVAAFYHFAELPDYRELQAPLRQLAAAHGVRGTILLAAEGVNGTLAGSRAGVEAVLNHLRADPRLAALEHKESAARELPFKRLKVRLKREIVTLGVGPLDVNRGGKRVPPAEWNALIADPEVLVLDTRNGYEVAVGTFKNAVNPETKSFRDFPDFVRRNLDPARHRRVAMFCTGGIRCEKASAFMLGQGFAEVYQLQGGILKYLEEVPPEQSLWQGDCFVFDERVGLGHGLALSELTTCRACGHPLTADDRASPAYVEGIACPHCRGSEHDSTIPGLPCSTRAPESATMPATPSRDDTETIPS